MATSTTSFSLGFAASVWMRCAWAVVFAVLVVGAVWLVEYRPVVAAARPVAAVAQVTRARCVVEATFDVGRWTVLADGQAASGTATARAWQGDVAAGELLVQAERVDAADLSPGALRVVWAGTERLAWGDGPVTVVVTAVRP